MRAMMRGVAVGLAACFLSACLGGGSAPVPGPSAAPANSPAAPARTVSGAPLLGSDGRCTGPAPATAVSIEPGISECDLVRLKGRVPTDVLVGESGRGQREVQVLYAEPGGRELYFFVDNRLDRIVR